MTAFDETKSGDHFKYHQELWTAAGWSLVWREGTDLAFVIHALTGKIIELPEFDNLNPSAGEVAEIATSTITRISNS